MGRGSESVANAMARTDKKRASKTDLLVGCFTRNKRPSVADLGSSDHPSTGSGRARAKSVPARTHIDESQVGEASDSVSAELRLQALTLLRESVEQTYLRLSSARRKNFRHSEAGLRLAVSNANKLLADPEASAGSLLECLASVEAEAQLLAIPTDAQTLRSDLERLRELVISLHTLQANTSKSAEEAEQEMAIAPEASALRAQLTADFTNHQREAGDEEMQKVAAEFAMFLPQLDRLLASDICAKACKEQNNRARASTSAAAYGALERAKSPSGTYACALERASSPSGTYAGALERARSPVGTYAGALERASSPSGTHAVAAAASSGGAPGRGRSPSQEFEGAPEESGTPPGAEATEELNRSLGGQAKEKNRLQAAMERASEKAQGKLERASKRVSAVSDGASGGLRAVGHMLRHPAGGVNAGDPIAPTSSAGSASRGSFVLQDWDSENSKSFVMDPAEVEQLNKLRINAVALVEAHREVATLVAATADHIDEIEQQVADTVENTDAAIDELVQADEIKARGWTLKAACPSAAVGIGVGFCVGGPVGAAVVGGVAAVGGAMIGKAAKWRHNRNIEALLSGREEGMDRRRSRHRLSQSGPPRMRDRAASDEAISPSDGS